MWWALINYRPDLISFLTNHGQLALFIILMIEEAGMPLPIPGDLILVYAGILIGQNKLTFWQVLFASTLGVIIGGTFLYVICRLGGRYFVDRFGKYFFLPPKRVRELEKWFIKRGKTAVIIGRFIPGIRVLLSAVAGLMKLPFGWFLAQITGASLLWIAIFTLSGFYLGEKWHGLAREITRYGYLPFIIFIITIIFHLLRQQRKNR